MLSGHMNLDNRILTLVASETLALTPAELKVGFSKNTFIKCHKRERNITCGFLRNSV